MVEKSPCNTCFFVFVKLCTLKFLFNFHISFENMTLQYPLFSAVSLLDSFLFVSCVMM